MIGGGCQHRWRAGHSSSECTLKTCLLCVSWKSKLYWTEKQRFGVSLVRASSVRPSVQGCVSAGGGLPGSSLPHLLAPSLAQKVPRVCASRHEATLGPDWSVSAAGRPVYSRRGLKMCGGWAWKTVLGQVAPGQGWRAGHQPSLEEGAEALGQELVINRSVQSSFILELNS